MRETKNLDKLFQEKFKDFDAAAPETAWPHIEEKLKEKKKRRVIPIWWKLSGIAAALLIGFAVYEGLTRPQGRVQNEVVIREIDNHTPLNNKTLPENHVKDSAVAGSEAIGENKDSNKTNAVLPNKIQVAETPDFDKKKSNAIADQIKSKISVPVKEQIAASENSPQKSNRNRSNSLNRSNAIQNQSGLAGNSNATVKPVKRKNFSLKAQKAMNRNPLENPKSKTQNQSDRQSENPDSKIAQQNSADLKSATDKTMSVPADNQQPIADKETENADRSPNKKLDSTAIATVVPNALEELLNEKENNLVTKGTRINRWQITSSVAPIYFGSASGGSPIDSAFSSNSKSYKTNLSVRLGVNYAISKKFTVRAAISQVTLDYNTNDVLISAGFQRNPLGNVNTTNENQFLNFGKKASMKTAAVAETPGTLSTDEFSSSLNQRMGYIEVPVEVSYAVIDRQFGLNIIGGVSTLFLNENKIIVVSDGLTTDLGEANNLSKTHFSTNIGLGMKYRFFRAFQASFEPMFKYQLHTFSKEAGNFKPYYFGLYTGLSFNF